MGVLYLYGAAVQGIQDFIFQTNELRDIVGASELVEQICTNAFEEFTKGVDGEPVVMAAGNIKFIFRSREDCERAVLLFPKKVMEMAPGVTISQAVVKYEIESGFGKAVDELEAKLRTQRNKKSPSITIGKIGMQRSRKTGRPVVFRDGQEHLDASIIEKRKYNRPLTLCEKFFGFKPKAELFSYNIGDMTGNNDWIAVIHADGNGLGAIVQKVGKNIADFRFFSEELDRATRKSAQEAYAELSEVAHFLPEKPIPIRPIVLSGDDMTVICRGDLAFDLCRLFLERFEENTKILAPVLKKYQVFENGNDHLTACAGIAFIKSSYPFYYGYDLAEDLCTRAKKDAKAGDVAQKRAPSCLMFHKVQDSFVVSFDEISRRELTTSTASFEYGPYYLDEKENRFTIERLAAICAMLEGEDGNAVKTDIRQWLSLMHTSEGSAKQKERRVSSLLSGRCKRLFAEATEPVDRDGVKTYPAYDILSLKSIYQSIK